MDSLVVMAVGGVVVGVVCLIGVVLIASGNWTWTPSMSREGKWLWSAALLITMGLVGVVFGLPAVVAAWPLWLGLLLVTAILFLVTDAHYGFGRLARPKRQTLSPATPSWDDLWLSYEGKPLPPWMLQAAMQGQVTYAGKVAQVKDGVLVPQAKPHAAGLETLFQKMDRLLG